MKGYIKEQLALHPSIMPQDVVKMCFQAAYGAEHLLTDIEKVRAYFDSEWEKCEAKEELLAEFIAPDVCRVNLGAWKKRGLPPEWLFNIFVQAASVAMEDSEQKFFEYVREWEDTLRHCEERKRRSNPPIPIKCSQWIASSGLCPPRNDEISFQLSAFQAYMQSYLANCENGKPRAVHHSRQYRDAERPAYRVVSGTQIQLVEFFNRLEYFPQRFPIVIAIDGRAASGKSTLAANMKATMGAEVIHMDDFFLPAELRTTERLAQPGGNIHYERFTGEVLPHLRSGRAFEYRIFDCGAMDYVGTRQVAEADILVVEGVYSRHPAFGKYFDLAVFCDIDPTEQIHRIEKRNGTHLANLFATKWIPMEEKYFNEFHIRENASVTI